jgi:PAS domain-containing protein
MRSFILVPMIVIVLLFGASTYLAKRFIDETRTDRSLLERSHAIVELTANLRMATVDSSLRVMYHITGLGAEDPATLRLAIGQVPATLAKLGSLVGEDQEQSERLDRITAMLRARADLLESLIGKGWNGAFEERRLILARYNLHINPARAAILAFMRREEEKLALRHQTLEQSLRRTIWLLVAAMTGALIACLAALFFFRNQQQEQRLRIAELDDVNRQIQRQHEALQSAQRRLSAILDNGLDGIMLVSPDGTIVLANRAASARLGVSDQTITGPS